MIAGVDRATPRPGGGCRGVRRRAVAGALAAAFAALVVVPFSPPAAGQSGRIDFALGARPLTGLRPDRAALLLSGRDGGAVEVAAVALPIPRPEGGGRVLLFAEIGGASLLGAQAPAAPRLEVYAYALTADGSVAGFLAQGIDLDLDRVGEAIYSGGLKFAGGLDLPAGSYSVHLLVFEAAAQRYGLRILTVDLGGGADSDSAAAAPPGAATARILSAPLFPEPLGSWLLVGEAPRPGQPASGIGAILAGGGPLPAALPLLPAGGSAVADLLVAGAPAGDLEAAVVLTAAREEGGREHEVDAQVIERAPSDLAGVERLRLEVSLAGVEPGRYRLRAEVGAGHRDRLRSPPLEVAVVSGPGGGLTGSGLTWASLDRPESAAAAAATLPTAEPRRKRRRGDAKVLGGLAGGYREALAMLAAGSVAEAQEAMRRFEKEAVGRLAGDSATALVDGEIAALEDLADHDPEALVPPMVLHLDLYPLYLADHDYLLAVHSRSLVEGIAELYARSAATDAARVLASRALTRLGLALERAQLMAKARGLLVRATQLDPSDPQALLALATGHEKVGEYDQAVAPLRRLVEIDPKSAEGRLRLAINLDRTGHAADAAALCRRLVSEANPDWVLSLAYQILAREQLAAGRPQAAVQVLAQAVDRLPGEERLRIALAYARDRAGDPGGARAAVEDLSLGSHGRTRTSRWRYNEWPEAAQDESAELLARNARARLASLAGALDGGGGRRR